MRAGLALAGGETDPGSDLHMLVAIGGLDAGQDEHTPTGRVKTQRWGSVFTQATLVVLGAPVGVGSRVGHGLDRCRFQ